MSKKPNGERNSGEATALLEAWGKGDGAALDHWNTARAWLYDALGG